MLKANQTPGGGGGSSGSGSNGGGGQSGSSGPGGSTPLKFEDQTPTSTSPQTPPDSPDGDSQTPTHVGGNPSLVSPSSLMSESNGPIGGGGGSNHNNNNPNNNPHHNNNQQQQQHNNPLHSSSSSTGVSPPSVMSPQGLSWEHHMAPSKVPNMGNLGNSYIPQYSWYHHGHDPNMNPHQLLT